MAIQVKEFEIFEHQFKHYLKGRSKYFKISIIFMNEPIFQGTVKADSISDLEAGFTLFFEQTGLKFPSPLLFIRYSY